MTYYYQVLPTFFPLVASLPIPFVSRVRTAINELESSLMRLISQGRLDDGRLIAVMSVSPVLSTGGKRGRN